VSFSYAVLLGKRLDVSWLSHGTAQQADCMLHGRSEDTAVACSAAIPERLHCSTCSNHDCKLTHLAVSMHKISGTVRLAAGTKQQGRS
jgi:hypothetical protein